MTLTIGKFTPFNTVIHRLDARVKLIGLIIFLVATFLSYGTGYMNLVINGGILVIVIILSIISKTSFLKLFKSLKAMWMMIILLLILNIFLPSSSTGDFFFIGEVKIYYRTIINVSFILLRLIIVLAETNIFTSTTKPMDMTYALEWLFSPLKVLKVPIHKFSMTISLALRFIPTLAEESERIMKAQASRGVDYKQGKLKDKVKAIISLIIPLFISSLTTSSELTDAMEARGYNPDSKRSRYKLQKWSLRDTFGIIFLAVLLTAIIILAIYRFDLFAYLGVSLPKL